MKECRGLRVLKHHPIRGSYERSLDLSGHLLSTIDPRTLSATNTYPMRDVHLLPSAWQPHDGTVRLSVPSRFLCGLPEVLTLSPINSYQYPQLLEAVQEAIATASPALAASATAPSTLLSLGSYPSRSSDCFYCTGDSEVKVIDKDLAATDHPAATPTAPRAIDSPCGNTPEVDFAVEARLEERLTDLAGIAAAPVSETADVALAAAAALEKVPYSPRENLPSPPSADSPASAADVAASAA